MNFGTNSQILMKVSFLLSRRIYQFSSYKLEHAVACYIHKHKVNIPFLPILRVETTETGIFPSFCSLVFMLIKQNPDLRQSMLENQQDKQLEDTNRPAPPTNPDKGVARAGKGWLLATPRPNQVPDAQSRTKRQRCSCRCL